MGVYSQDTINTNVKKDLGMTNAMERFAALEKKAKTPEVKTDA